MSAGGSSYPVTFLMIVKGDSEVIAAARNMQSAFSQMGNVGKQAASGINAVNEESQKAGKQIGALASVQSVATSSGERMSAVYDRTGKVMSGAASEASNLGRSYSTTISPTNQLVGATDKLGVAAQNQAKGLSLSQTMMQSIRPHMTGLVIMSTMMANSMSEAAFMGDVLADAHKRTGEAQSKLTALEAEGMRGTTAYTRAKAELAKAERAEAIFRRNANQASMDQLNFLVLIGTQFVPVIKATNDWAKSNLNAAGSMGKVARAINAMSLTSIRTGIINAANSMKGLQSSSIATATSMKSLQASSVTTAASTGTLTAAMRNTQTASGGLVAGIAPLAVAERAAATSSFQMTGAIVGMRAGLATVGPTAAVASAGITTLGAAMKVLLLNPLTIGLVALSVVMGALATNAFGFRDKMNEVGKSIGDAVPALRPLLEGLRELGKAFGLVTDEVKDLHPELEKLDNGMLNLSQRFNGIDLAIGRLGDKSAMMKKITEEQTAAEQDQYLTDRVLLEGKGLIIKAQQIETEVARRAAQFIEDDAKKTEDLHQKQFDLIASVYGVTAAMKLNENQYAGVAVIAHRRAVELGIEEDKTDELKTSIDDLNEGYAASAAELPKLSSQLHIKNQWENESTKNQAIAARALEDVGKARNDDQDKIREEALALQLLNVGLQYNGDVLHDDIGNVKAFVDAHADALKAIDKTTTGLDDYNAGIDENAKKGRLLVEQLGQTGQQVLKNSKDFAIFNMAHDEYLKRTVMADDATRAEAITLQMLHPALIDAFDALHGNIDATKELVDNTNDADKAMTDAKDTLRVLSDGFHNTREANDLLINSLNDSGVAFSGNDEEASAFAAALLNVRKQGEDGYATLVKDAVALGYIGDTSKAATESMKDYVTTATAAKKADEDATKAKQDLADAYGILITKQFAATQEGKNFVDVAQTLGGTMDSAIKTGRLFAITHGVDIHKALTASGKDLVAILSDFDNLDFSQEAAAKKAEDAAKRFADEWKAGLDKTKANFEKASSNFSSALDTVMDRVAKGMDLSKQSEKEGVGVKFVSDFWDRWFPTEIVEAKFQDHMDMDKLIKGLKKNLDNALDDNQLTPAQAKRWFGGLTDFMDNLPKDAHKAFGELVGAIPNMRELMEPKLVMGTIEVGHKMQNAIKDELVGKMISNLEKGKPAIAGLEKTIAHMPKAAGVSANEFKEVTGLFAGAMKSAKGDTDLQVQSLLAIFDDINPAWSGVIMQIDRDADNIPDIMDNKVGKPFEAMAKAIGDAIVKALEEFGLLPQKIGEQADAAVIQANKFPDGVAAIPGKLTGPVNDIDKKFEGLGQSMKVSVDDMNKMLNEDLQNGVTGFKDSLDGIYTVTNESLGKTTKSVYDFKTGVITDFNEVADSADTNKTSVSGWGDYARQAWNGVKDAADTNAPSVVSALNSFGQPMQDVGEQFKELGRTTKVSFGDITKLFNEDLKDGFVGFTRAMDGVATVTNESMGKTTKTIYDFKTGTIINLDEVSKKLDTSKGDATVFGTNVHDAFGGAATDVNTSTGGIKEDLSTLDAAVSTTTGMSIAWINYQLAVKGALEAIGRHITDFKTALTTLQTDVSTALQAVAQTWVTNVGTIGQQLVNIRNYFAASAANYGSYRSGVNQVLIELSQSWVSHATIMGQQVARILGFFRSSANNYIAYAGGVTQTLSTLSKSWTDHATAMGEQVGRILGFFRSSANNYIAYASGVGQTLRTLSQNWTDHASAIGTQTNRIAGSLTTSTGRYNAYLTAIRSTLSQVNSAWAASASSISASTNRIASSVEAMSRRVIAADNREISSLKSLQSQINSMHGTTITNTIRTVKTTSTSSGTTSTSSSTASHFNAGGAITGQHGYFGIVNNPQSFRFGEGGSKELVAAIPVGKGRSSDSSRMIQTLLQGTRGIKGGGSREVVIISPIILDGKEIGRNQRRHSFSGIDSVL